MFLRGHEGGKLRYEKVAYTEKHKERSPRGIRVLPRRNLRVYQSLPAAA